MINVVVIAGVSVAGDNRSGVTPSDGVDGDD
jgi:hypothetical protein